MNISHSRAAKADNARTVIRSTTELAPGDYVQAWYHGNLVRQGKVTDIAPHQGLFWIQDLFTGCRRLLDLHEFDIVRGPAPAGPVSVPA